jgi:hypothetical protein
MRTVIVASPKIAPKPEWGGVELEFDAVTRLEEAGVRVVQLDPGDVADGIKADRSDARAVVFVQTEGRLSPRYRGHADEWLDAGAVVVEKNIFSLPSRWRPVHPRYLMAVMSLDGLHRYGLRSSCAYLQPVERALLLPNPLLPRLARATPWADDGVSPVVLLRLGRPDPRKWTTFEMRWARALSRRSPQRQFHLRLVGCPASVQGARFETSNLTISAEPYSTNPSALYADADVLVHHSRIGETFGNTLFEAAEAGLGIVCALAPRWDCGPLEYFEQSAARFATPRVHMSHPSLPVTAVGSGVLRRPTAREMVHALLSAESGPTREMPPLLDCVRGVLSAAAQLGSPRTAGPLVVAAEAARALRRRGQASPDQ